MAKKAKRTRRYSATHSADAKKQKSRKIRRYIYAALVFLLVAATVFFLVVRGNGQITLPENAIGSLITPVQNAVSSVTNSVKQLVTNWRNYDELQDAYAALSFENEQMSMELISAEEALMENERLKAMLDARDTYTSLDPVYAKVIARDAGVWFQTFSVNRGSSHGVSNGMAVVNGDGLIGRVYEVGLNYSKVITIIDPRSAVACLIQRTRDAGVMRGQITASDNAAECFVYYLPNINSITPGDVVVTSGTDSLYPKGLKIGSVSAVSLDAGSDGTYAIVSPAVDFQRIEEVFILRTVIETDSDMLPSINLANPNVPTPTPRINVVATATPEPTADPNWYRPTPMPGPEDILQNGYIGNLIEDKWAESN